MVVGVPALVSYVSQFMTLLPGDVISTGTPAGVGLGMKPPTYLRPGDEVTLGIDRLGQSRQRVVESGMIPVSATEPTQAWPRPAHPRPIVIIGAGGIVRAAHLPTYRALGFPSPVCSTCAPTPRDRPPTPLRSTRYSRRSPTPSASPGASSISRSPATRSSGSWRSFPAAPAC